MSEESAGVSLTARLRALEAEWRDNAKVLDGHGSLGHYFDVCADDLTVALRELEQQYEHDPLCSEGIQAGDQTMPCDCQSLEVRWQRRAEAAEARVRELEGKLPPEPRLTQGRKYSEWWVCFKCWIAYHVPTTGYYGDCQDCGTPTIPLCVAPEKLKCLVIQPAPPSPAR